MDTDRAIDIVIEHLGIGGALLDTDGRQRIEFGDNLPGYIQEIDTETVCLVTHFETVDPSEPLAARELLEANCLGMETGAARISTATDIPGAALSQTVALGALDDAGFENVLEQFLGYSAYWYAERLNALDNQVADKKSARAQVSSDHTTIIRG